MKLVIVAAGLALLAVSTPAQAVVYCQYVGVPAGCVVRPGVALRAAPGVGVPGVGAPGVGAPGVAGVAGPGAGAPGVGVRAGPAGTANMGGPVNRAGAR
jgi:hypothetical protein